jgi:hypothetical protein
LHELRFRRRRRIVTSLDFLERIGSRRRIIQAPDELLGRRVEKIRRQRCRQMDGRRILPVRCPTSEALIYRLHIARIRGGRKPHATPLHAPIRQG